MERSTLSLELYEMMIKMGYPEAFATLVSMNLNTDWTARRMIGYLKNAKKVRPEEVADEMIEILEDRERIIEKKQMESSNMKWNEWLNSERDE